MDFKIELFLIYGWGKRKLGYSSNISQQLSSDGLYLIVEVGRGGDIYRWNFETGDNIYYQNFEDGGGV